MTSVSWRSPTADALVGFVRALGGLYAGPNRQLPTGAGYSVLLLLHVASAVVGFGAICVTGLQASRAARGPAGPKAAAVRRYFRPGTNWVARAIYGVPVFGFALLASSGGKFDSSDTFVVTGLVLWLVAAVTAEVVVWPGERRIQAAVTRDWSDHEDGTIRPTDPALAKQCVRVASAAGLLAAVFLASVVVMFARP